MKFHFRHLKKQNWEIFLAKFQSLLQWLLLNDKSKIGKRMKQRLAGFNVYNDLLVYFAS